MNTTISLAVPKEARVVLRFDCKVSDLMQLKEQLAAVPKSDRSQWPFSRLMDGIEEAIQKAEKDWTVFDMGGTN